MIAGRGITHSERFERARREGDRLDGIQAWIALPREHEETEPSFAHHGARELPVIEAQGLRLRVIAGELLGATAPVRTHSRMFYAQCAIDGDARASIAADYPERAAYVARGAIEMDGRTLRAGEMAVLAPGTTVQFVAREPSIVMLLGGEPVGHRYIEWNFVASTRERIEQAKADWRAGRFKLPDRDNAEFIPLPPDPPPPANPMS
jgi:redox-sensitive bicupin YhaK (pirin superfamily)